MSTKLDHWTLEVLLRQSNQTIRIRRRAIVTVQTLQTFFQATSVKKLKVCPSVAQRRNDRRDQKILKTIEPRSVRLQRRDNSYITLGRTRRWSRNGIFFDRSVVRRSEFLNRLRFRETGPWHVHDYSRARIIISYHSSSSSSFSYAIK